MNPLAVEAVGLMAPGLAGWTISQAVLAGQRPYIAEPMPATIATLLPANERRRVTATVRLALQVAQEAMAQADIDAGAVRTVFASSGGDREILDKICVALTQPDRPVSPTHFHQSVHNTPAGYWAIATGCMQPSLSLSAYDDSFAAGFTLGEPGRRGLVGVAEGTQVTNPRRALARSTPRGVHMDTQRHILGQRVMTLMRFPRSARWVQAQTPGATSAGVDDPTGALALWFGAGAPGGSKLP